MIDVSYPRNKAEREACRGASTAEIIQGLLPTAIVFKGWNHLFAQHLTNPQVGGIAASVLIAGDDPTAKDTVFGIARNMGFHPVECGAVEGGP